MATTVDPVNLRVVNKNGKAEIHVQAGQEVVVVADLPGKGGPADTNATAAGNGQTATVPLDGSVPTAGGPGSSVPTGEKLDDAHRSWYSIGDPHIKMGNETFDNQHRGDFILQQSQDKSYQVQARQEGVGGGNVTVNTAVAIKDADNVVSYDSKTKKMLVNGKEWDGQTQPAGGTKIEKIGDGYTVTSSKGDVTNIHDKGGYLDLDGKLGPDRTAGEIRGAHGVFDNTDDNKSWIKRDGTQAGDREQMIDDWKVKPEEDLFAAAGKGGPGANPADPAKPADPANPADPAGKGGPAGQIDDATKKALTEILGQLQNLMKSLTDLLAKLGGQPANKAAPAAAAEGKGGPAAADPTAKKTFADQRKEDDKKAEEQKAAAKAADAKAADAKAADAKAADAKAADGKGGPAAAADGGDIFAQITQALKGLMELLTKLVAQLQGGAAQPAAAATDAAKKAA